MVASTLPVALVAIINLVTKPGLWVQAHIQYGVSLVLDRWLAEVSDEGGRTRKQPKFLFLKEENFKELLDRGQFTLVLTGSNGNKVRPYTAHFNRAGDLIIEVRARPGNPGSNDVTYVFEKDAGLRELENAFSILRQWLDSLAFLDKAKEAAPKAAVPPTAG